MYNTGIAIPTKKTNHGALINPPLNFQFLIPSLKQNPSDNSLKVLEHKWLLLYVNPKACETLCLNTLYKIRQTHIALDKDSSRLIRVLLTSTPLSNEQERKIDTQYPGTYSYFIPSLIVQRFFALSPFNQDLLKQGRLYIVDPLGNVILTYPLTTSFESLLSDLKRLLQLSHIG